ncbi:MAG TPA: PilZ domain-containing protein [Solirubrobacteraceae bacterium]|nr:PilZ domain-containing protein [Solirubrobacteraceae bacterium]
MSTPADTGTSNVRSLPGEGQGKLTTPDGEQLPVRTFKRGKDVVLVVLVDSDDHCAEDRLESADLEYTSMRGVVRLHGEAVFEESSLIRFQADGPADVSQRRSFVRVTAPQPVTVEADETIKRLAYTVDISGGGMLLTGGDGLEPDQRVRFRMALGHGEIPIAGTARVVRIRDDGKRALVFDEIDEDDRQRLIRFVFECMRTARARTRGDWL